MADEPRPAADPERAWAPYEPSPRCPWTLARAAHLLRRAGFGPTWEELQRALKDGPQRTVDRLLRPPEGADETLRTLDRDDQAAAASGAADSLRPWWLRRLLESPFPLQEKMTLFWHDHFATGAERVPPASMALARLRLLRLNALGRFPALLAGIVRDPATLLALAAESNRKARPEEAYARRILHRYSVGPDACTDRDVRDAARAMTGWFVLRGELRFIEREHDAGEKAVLGRTGPMGDADLAAAAAAHPATARNVARRLVRWLVSETDEPTDADLAPVARAFGPEGDIARAVETILRSARFFDDASIRRRVKRPVEFVVGLVRGLDGRVAPLKLVDDLAGLGEDLLRPPTPDGWPGGRHWLNPATMLARANLAAAMLDPKGPHGSALDPAAAAERHGHAGPAEAARFLAYLWLQPGEGGAVPGKDIRGAPDRLRAFAHRIAASPEFQLA
jgi:uncharacterized protein (DUF1800 family)